jgi:hypothetical protein
MTRPGLRAGFSWRGSRFALSSTLDAIGTQMDWLPAQATFDEFVLPWLPFYAAWADFAHPQREAVADGCGGRRLEMKLHPRTPGPA